MTCSLGSFDHDDATISSTADVPTLPYENLLTRPPYEVYRGDSGTSAFGALYWGGASFPVTQFGLLYTNGTDGMDIRIRAGSNPSTVTSAPAFDSGTFSFNPGSRDWSTFGRTHFLLDLGSTVTQGCWRFDVTINGEAPYFQAGRVVIGNPWRPTRGIDFGDRIESVDTAQRRRSRNATLHSVPGGVYREVELTIASFDEQEFLATAGDLRRRVAGGVPLLYCKNPRGLSLGNSPTGGIAMYTDPDLMDHCLYAIAAEQWYPNNLQRTVYRMRISLAEVVHP